MPSGGDWAESREFSFSQKDFRFLADLVHAKTGIVLADHKRDMVYSRLARRLRALKLTRFSDYCALLEGEQGTEEMANLVNAITTNLTSFFRESHHFDHLRDEVLGPLLAARAERIRIWSAGCSSGMEPYSIALTLAHAQKDGRCDAKILATDIDTTMLARGRAGEYPADQYEHIPAAYRSLVALDKTANCLRMSEPLRRRITFNYLNLLESWPMKGPFDAIFCRNVVIYFNKETQKKLFSRMADLLSPNGWLYIGHSENLFNICDRFELTGRTIYRRIR